MNNFEKYFKDSKTTAETLEKILNNQIKICDMCNFVNCEPDCANNQLLDDYDCCDGIKYWLQLPFNG